MPWHGRSPGAACLSIGCGGRSSHERTPQVLSLGSANHTGSAVWFAENTAISVA